MGVSLYPTYRALTNRLKHRRHIHFRLLLGKINNSYLRFPSPRGGLGMDAALASEHKCCGVRNGWPDILVIGDQKGSITKPRRFLLSA
jgi:hypothetical protein